MALQKGVCRTVAVGLHDHQQCWRWFACHTRPPSGSGRSVAGHLTIYIFSSALRCCVLPKTRNVKIKLISQNNINIQYIYIYYNIFIRALMAPGGVCIAVSRLLCHQIIILYCIWFVQQLSLFACCGIWSCGQAYAFIHTVYIHTSTASAS